MVPLMKELNAWTKRFRAIYDKAVELYRTVNTDLASYFSAEEKAFLDSIGIKPINVYDYAEDFSDSSEPDWDTVLLMVAARRDYLLYEQRGKSAPTEINESELPPKSAEMEGIPWLPRIIRKAKCFLHGDLCHNIMYCCGGDRRFLKNHGIHPADFLRAVWGANGDDQKVLEFVRAAAKA